MANLDRLAHEQNAIDQIKLWKHDPLLFARQVFKFNPGAQQLQLFYELQKLVNAKCKVDEGQPLTPEERIYAKKRGISVRAGKGVGKDAAAAIIVYWFLTCFYESKSYLLAPSMTNLQSNLIAELAKWKSRRIQGEPACLLSDEYDLMASGLRLKSAPEKGKNWFVQCNSAGPNIPADQQVEVLQGKHSRYMMFVMDEASGIPDPVFSPLDTTLTDPVNFILLFFNPTRRTGFAIDTHFSAEAKYWIPLHWNAEESDMVTPDQIEYLREKFGRHSIEYRVSVLGEPPAADSDSLIPYEWCINAKELQLETQPNDPIVFGVDVARQGDDSSVILVRQGPVIHEIHELQKVDTVELSRWVAMRAADWDPQAIYIDAAGLGVGVYDELRRQGVPNVYAVNVGIAPRTDKFVRLRDELWWELRQRFEHNRISLASTPDMQLIAELSGIKFAVNDHGKIKVESKLEMRKRNMPSPNKADALMLTMTAPDTALVVARKEQERERESSRNQRRVHRINRSWMGV